MTKTYIDELAEEIATLRDYYAKAITREREMATKFNNAYWENLQLKELLKECREYVVNTPVYPQGDDNKQAEIHRLVDKINEVLK